MSKDILAVNDGLIVRVTLNRPDEGNAVSDQMAIELTQVLNSAAQTARLVVLRGAGKDFCVGRATMGQRPSTRPEALVWRRQSDVIFNCYAAFRRCPIPIVCVVEGRALGFGCAIAGLADITLAADTATFQIPEMAHNIMPTMVLSALIDRVPRKALTYLVYSTATINAERARDSGLVSEVATAAELAGLTQTVCDAVIKAPPPAAEGVKEYLRTAIAMDGPASIEYARSLHATVNSSAEMGR
jgi:enoyl-CoA hydratase/carnithine racemase